MKNERGITLLILVITIIIMVILLSVSVEYGVGSLGVTRFQNFSYELQQIQGKVDTIYEKVKLGNEKYITIGSNVTDNKEAVNTLEKVKDINYSNIMEEEIEKYYYEYPSVTYYRYLTQKDLKDNLDITSEPGDVIINFRTREVISVKGFEYEGKTYYTLDDI